MCTCSTLELFTLWWWCFKGHQNIDDSSKIASHIHFVRGSGIFPSSRFPGGEPVRLRKKILIKNWKMLIILLFSCYLNPRWAKVIVISQLGRCLIACDVAILSYHFFLITRYAKVIVINRIWRFVILSSCIFIVYF